MTLKMKQKGQSDRSYTLEGLKGLLWQEWQEQGQQCPLQLQRLTTMQVTSLTFRYSVLCRSFSVVVSVVVYVKRFIQRICNQGTKGSLGTISPEEMTEAVMILLRQELQQCVKCSRFTAKLSAPLMGDLLKERIDVPTIAFKNVGLDFAGPFLQTKQQG